ncbi:MAG: DUF1015 domain-containing protein [Clostridia bacterium]|nr:DUF1015 domain-containing protein [Clostridia bacterium]
MSYDALGIAPASFLLPREHVTLSKWACVACDQYTSQPEYWEEVRALTDGVPSCLNLVLPECWLPRTEEMVPQIHQEMRRYLDDGVLAPLEEGFILLERTTESGARLGLVCTVDLEKYDFTGKKSLIRPTEETITARLPARQAIRRNAPLESSHIMLLLDDPARTVIEPLYARRGSLPALYDFPLMQGGGHLRGWHVTGREELSAVAAALEALKTALGGEPLLFAVGDGNHSLATAKAHWNEVKAGLSPAEQAVHPARYAMVEVENIHDDALQFEPIHRVLTGVDGAALLADWQAYCAQKGMTLSGEAAEESQSVTLVLPGEERTLHIHHPDGPLPAATLQRYLDDFLSRHPEAEIDYIHGDDVLRDLARRPGAAGFLLPPLDKHAFFAAIQALGTLPRKTFSMGHAHEKRFYMECRRIR